MTELNKLPQQINYFFFFIIRWFDNHATPIHTGKNQVDWGRIIPFVAIHLACFGVFWVGYSACALSIAIALYVLRIFAIGGFYHRYFSHKTFQTNRFWQCIFAILGMAAVQRGPLWWAAHHRNHHLVSDQANDPHSPVQHGFWWSHMGWFLSKKFFHYNQERIKDFSRYPELQFLDRFDVIVPLLLGALLYGIGEYLAYFHPHLETNGLQLFIWGFCISTVCVLHATFTINSLSHCFGSKPFQTRDDSRNNLILSVITLGEGWHNNHHFYPACARQGFKWWEIDITYYLLLLLEKMRIIKNLRRLPSSVLTKRYVSS